MGSRLQAIQQEIAKTEGNPTFYRAKQTHPIVYVFSREILTRPQVREVDSTHKFILPLPGNWGDDVRELSDFI